MQENVTTVVLEISRQKTFDSVERTVKLVIILSELSALAAIYPPSFVYYLL